MKEYKFNVGDQMVWHENYDRLDRDGNTVMRCTVCARILGDNPYIVEVVDGGNLAPIGVNDENDPGYMGCWPIGNECAKTFSPELLLKSNWTN